MIGNVFLPPTAYGGQIQWVRDFVRRDGDRFPVADKMIQVARHYGFDGWFLNQETAGGNTQLANDMRDFIVYLKKSGLRVIWYDAMTDSGSVSWQNALTARNRMFFEQSDEMFMNFWWSTQGLANSAALAQQMGRSPYDLASGVDVESNGYNTSVGWACVFPEGKPHVTSLGFYRPEWTFKSSTSPADFYSRDNRFWVGQNGDPSNTTTTASWKGVAHYVTELTPITSAAVRDELQHRARQEVRGRRHGPVDAGLEQPVVAGRAADVAVERHRHRHEGHAVARLGRPVRRRHRAEDHRHSRCPSTTSSCSRRR